MTFDKPFEHEAGKGMVFQNKSDNPKAPQWTGHVKDPDGRVWDISLWTHDDEGHPRLTKSEKRKVDIALQVPWEERKKKSMTPNTEQGDPGPQGDPFGLGDSVPF